MAQTVIGKVSIIPCGEFQPNTSYSRLSVVSYNGSSYIATSDNENVPVTDTSVWYLLASKGEQGNKGDKGDKGDTYEVTQEDLNAIAAQITSDASSAFNQNVTVKTNAFNDNAVAKTSDFDSNATNKTTAFNNNASSKTSDFNTNATTKTNDFNNNASAETVTFNDNATDKTNAFNTNAEEKTEDFDEHVASYTTRLEEVENVSETNAKHIQALEDNFDIATTPNSNDFALTDCASGFTKNIKIGETELTQITTTGKQMYNKDTSVSGYNIDASGNIIKNSEFLYSALIDVTQTDYVISGKSNFEGSRNRRIHGYDANGNWVVQIDYASITGVTNYAKAFTINNNNVKYIRVSMPNNDTEVQVEKGSTATEYEPYTNGASPSPDYPQDIHIVEGECSVEESNKNLFDKTKVSTGYINYTTGVFTYYEKYKTSDYIVVEEGETYYSNYEYYHSSTTGVSYFDENKDFISGMELPDNHKLIPPASSKYVRISVRVLPISTETTGLTNIDEMYVVKGSSAIPYVEHKGNTFPLTLPTGMFLGKIGTSSNYIYGTKDNWKLHSGLAKVVLDGSESWRLGNSGTVNWMYELTLQDIKLLADIGKSNLYLLVNVLNSNTEQGFSIKINSTNNKNLLRVRYGTENTIENWKAQLTENNMIVYGCQETPTETDITDTTLIAQLNAISDNLQTYKGETLVFTTGSDLAPNIQFDYMVNPFASIEARLDLLET